MLRTTAMILGILGGVIGIVTVGVVFLLSDVNDVVGNSTPQFVGTVGRGWLALFFSVTGIVGGFLAGARTKLGGILMLVAASSGALSVSFAYVIAGLLLLTGGILALIARPRG